MSRRQALAIAGLGGVVAVGGGAATWNAVQPDHVDVGMTGRALAEPEVLSASGGSLEVTLQAASGVTIAGRRTSALGYNGTSPGPTLSVHPGDLVRVRLQNDLDTVTNLHTHGLHVSPEGRSDNVFRSVAPGTSFEYEFEIRKNHPTGTFWYHPHHHGTVADQIFGGLFGALLVIGEDDPQPAKDRVLVVSDTSLTRSGEVAATSRADAMMGREGDLVLVNGQARPEIEVQAGTVERWRVINACVSRFLDLELEHHTWSLLGYDGQALHAPLTRESVLLAPGNRADLLLQAPTSGRFPLRTREVDRGGMGRMMGGSATSPRTTLGSVSVTDSGSGTGQDQPTAPWSTTSAAREDLRSSRVDGRRALTMTGGMRMGMGGGGADFGFDGRPFDADRVDQRLVLGSVEEWTISNATMMDHPFHLHVWPMQIVAGAGHDPGGPPDWRDVVIVPARGSITVRIPIRDIGGKTVYHCHILDHEDLGMMGVVDAR